MSLYYADPDGTQCELQVDVMDEATAAAFMASDVPPILVCRLTRTTGSSAECWKSLMRLPVRPDLTMPEADLVIVGCGPVGAMAALRARQHGLSVIALDRESEVYRGRAVSMDDESSDSLPLQAFSMDCDPAFFRWCGVSRPSRPSHDWYRTSCRLRWTEWPSPCRRVRSARRGTMLREAAIGAGADLRFGADVAALDGNKLTLSDGATITGRWVLGSDGARAPCVDSLVSARARLR